MFSPGIRLSTLSISFSLLLCSPGLGADPADRTMKAATALYDGIRVETLPNGLRIYLKQIPESPVVTTMVAYRVGSADEDLSHTGLSHYLEHLMFKGTDRIKPGDIDRLTLRNGGANNAYTSEDLTNYHFDFAADRWEAALQVEADRMRNLKIDDAHEFQEEKGAVISELERDEDLPWDLESKLILPELFGKGPYSYPVIGERAHVRDATAQVIKGYYDRWYHPNNAALVIVGGFHPDRTMAKVKQLFGSIPAGALPERKPVPAVAKRSGPIEKKFESKFEVPRLLLGYNGVAATDPDAYALDVIQSVLSSGKTGRLYKKLVEAEVVADEVSASNQSGRYPGWFAVQVQLLKGKDRAKVEEMVLAELKRLGDEPVSDVELKRAKQGIVAGQVFARESVHGLADSIARAVTVTDLDYLKSYLPKIQAVTAADIQAVAKKYFDPDQRVSVWSIPKQSARGGGGRSPTRGATTALRRHERAEAAGGSAGFSLKNAQRVVLPNGLTLLLFENHRVPVVVAEAVVKSVKLLEPADKAGVATLVGNLLDEGTTKHTGPEIAEAIENVGGELGFSTNGANMRVLSSDRGLGLSLLFECLMEANFPKDAFAREQEQQLSQIDEAEQQPNTKASLTFRALTYGSHPYGRSALGTKETVKSLTPDDCAKFYRMLFAPNNTIVAIVGDFSPQAVIDEVTKLTAAWKPSELPKSTAPAPELPKELTQKIVTMPQAAQLHFYLGHPGIRRDNPDYFKLLVMDHVLGTGPGFTDRLSARLRDREGLAYTVSANITNSAGDERGSFTCYIGTEPKNFERVKAEFLEEINRLRDSKASPEEVEDAKMYLLGNLPFQLVTNSRIAGQLVMVERYGLGLDYLDKYRAAVAAVTPEDVQSVARKHLDPKRLILVAAGALGQDGKAIEKK